jgi:peptide-methionine (R)-S-oxide reductase
MISRRNLGKVGFLAAIAGAFGGQRILAGGTKEKTFEVTKSDEEWRRILSKEQYYVLRKHGTEYAFSSPLDKNYAPGTYHCAGCDLPLFSSDAKFDSGTGWPSFWQPLENAVGTSEDRSFFMVRTEVHCRRCGGHLGHVFNDGPKPTGLRYCMNGVALKFVPRASS